MLAEAATAEAEIAAGRWRGPLHGVPIGLKDLFETKGVPTTFGTISQKVISDRDATIVQRLKQAGAVILGHLHLHEGAFADHHPRLGNCINPWNADYWPGGSSSGPGSATAAGLVPSVTFPCGLATVSMPIGVQLVGKHLGEPTLLRAAHAFQQATDWHLRHPPLC